MDFFNSQICSFSNHINIILGKNGFGKSYFLKLLVSLLQEDKLASSNFFNENKQDAFAKCVVEKNGKFEDVIRIKTVFDQSIGKVAILSIPDVRYMDKSKSSISYVDIDEGKGNLREYGSYHFLHEKPYEALIQNFLYELCIIYLKMYLEI